MSRHGKVVVAMSGGVDSSVAACLLKEQGYECIGAFIRVGAHAAGGDDEACRLDEPRPRRLRHGCCSASDAQDARAVAGRLGLPFYALNFETDFEQIIDYFVDEYAAGRTPNPCVMCNIHVKFGKLLAYADLMDAEFIATGHYARILPAAGEPAPSAPGKQPLTPGTPPVVPGAPSVAAAAVRPAARLARARNTAKDQSYVLAGIRRAALPRCLFPLGEMSDKAEVRRLAAEIGLRVHDKPDSQEICFVPQNDYRQLLAARRPELLRGGDIVDDTGRVRGAHGGAAGFTIGQRRGLGVAAEQPLYVTRLDVLQNVVTIGPREQLLAGGLSAARVNWLIDPPAGPQRGTIKIRHMHAAAPGCFEFHPDPGATGDASAGGHLRVRFDEPQSAVTPGQAVVCYQDDVVAAGAWIESALPAAGAESISPAT